MTTDLGDEFEVPAKTLLQLLDCTITLASTDITLPGINCVMLRRQGAYLTATATDRYVVGRVRVPLDHDLPAPRPGWSFPLGLGDAKALRKLAYTKRASQGRARFVDQQDGTLSMPVSAVHFQEFGLPADRRPVGFPPVGGLLRSILSTVRTRPQVPGRLDLEKVAQFAPAAKVFRRACEGQAFWWDATPDYLEDNDGSTHPRWAVRMGDGSGLGLVGAVMGVRPGIGCAQCTDISGWEGLL